MTSKTTQIEKLTADVNRLTSLLREKEKEVIELRGKMRGTPKRREFDETRQLIQRLDEAEMGARTRNISPLSHDSNNFSSRKKEHPVARELTFESSHFYKGI